MGKFKRAEPFGRLASPCGLVTSTPSALEYFLIELTNEK